MRLRRLLPLVAVVAIVLTAVPARLVSAQDATSSVLAERAELDKALAADTEPRIAMLEKFLVSHPSSLLADQAREALVRTHATIGEKALKAGNAAAAGVAFKRALDAAGEKIPDRMFSQVIWQMPVVMASAGYRNESVELMRSFEPRFQSEAHRLIQIGFFYVQVESPPDAIRVLQRAVELSPGDYRAHNSLGTAYVLSLRLDDAANEFQRAIEIEPRAEFAYASLANLRRAFGNPIDAIDLYKKQLEITPDSPDTFGGLAVAYLLNDDDASATNAFGRAIALSPRDFRLFTTMAYLYASKGRVDKAREMLDLSLKYEPRFAWSHIVNGNILLSQKRYNEAISALNEASNYGDFPTLHFELAKAYMVNDQFSEAVDQLQAAFDITDDGQFETRLGDILDLRSSKLDLLLERERQAVLYLPVQPTTPTQYRLAESLARINHFLKLIPDATQPGAPAVQPVVPESRPLNLPSVAPSESPSNNVMTESPSTTTESPEPARAPAKEPEPQPSLQPEPQPEPKPSYQQPPAEQPMTEPAPSEPATTEPVPTDEPSEDLSPVELRNDQVPAEQPAEQPSDAPALKPLDLPSAEPQQPGSDTKLDLPDDPAAKQPPPPPHARYDAVRLPFVRVAVRYAAQDSPLVFRPRKPSSTPPPTVTSPQPEPKVEPPPADAPSVEPKTEPAPTDTPSSEPAPLSPLDPSSATKRTTAPTAVNPAPSGDPVPSKTAATNDPPPSTSITNPPPVEVVPKAQAEPVVEVKTGPNGREIDPGIREQLMSAVDSFVGVDDGREAFRKLWVARTLADKGVLLDRAQQLAEQALAAVDGATELDKSVRDLPDADRATRRAVLSARAQDTLGWVMLKRGDLAGAIGQLTSAANAAVKDPDAAVRIWHLGVAKQESGNDQEALDLYLRAYDPAAPGAPIRKRIIESLYVKLNGSTAGLDQRLVRP